MKSNSFRVRFVGALSGLLLVTFNGTGHAQISLTGTSYSENFDGMSTNLPGSSTTPTGWFVGGTGANGAVNGTTALNDTGASGTGTNYNYGVAGASSVTNRALGSVASGSGNRVSEVRFINNTGSAITNLFISYDGEQWRDGGDLGTINVLSMFFSTNGTTYAAMGTSLTFAGPQDSAVSAALDGHATANREVIGGIFQTNIPAGATFYLRWLDLNDTGADDGLAIDNFSLSVNLPGLTIVPNATNSWTNSVSGKWEDSTKWSAGLPLLTQPFHFITNAVSKTVTIDATTAAAPWTMAVSNLTVSAPSGAINTLFLDNAGTMTRLRVLGALKVDARGAIAVNNSAIIAMNQRFVLGSNGPNASLTITNGGAVFDTDGFVGFNSSSSNNTALVSGTGSVWSNSGFLILGDLGAGNTLTVTNGGAVSSDNTTVGLGNSSSNNVIVVTGAGSVLTSTNGMTIGSSGSRNQVFVLNGGKVVGFGRMGTVTGSSNNLVVVSGIGSVWSNGVTVGDAPGFGNQLIVSNGGMVAANSPLVGGLGGGSNTARVVDNGVWQNSGNLQIGKFGSSNNVVTIDGGSLSASNLFIGVLDGAIPSNNTVRVDNGSLFVTNALGTGKLVVSPGVGKSSLIINGGSVTADSLIATNGLNSVVNLNGGMLTVRGAEINHGVDFNVGGEARSGVLNFLGGTNRFANGLWVSPVTSATGAVWMTDGQLVVTNADSFVGRAGLGQMTVSNGTWLARGVTVGFGPVSIGTLRIAGGTNHFANAFSVGTQQDSIGTVWVTGGELISTNGLTWVGSNGFGQVTVSNGTWRSGYITVGRDDGSRGALNIAGGTSFFMSDLDIGLFTGATGEVWVTGGELFATNSGAVWVSEDGFGRLTISNGLFRANIVRVGFGFGRGEFNVAGGTSVVTSNLTIGKLACTSTGIVNVVGGSLFVTNATGNATLEVHSGTVTLNSGTLTINSLVITNACGRFLKTGGTLSITTTNLTAGLDADGDGLPNSWETGFGLSPFMDTGNDGASGDPDGDGVTNLQEFNAGTDPTNGASLPPNSWATSASGKWETGANWVLTIPPGSNQVVFVTNTTTKTVTIDATTTNSSGAMTVSNLTVSAPIGSINTLFLNNAGLGTPLRVRNNFSISDRGVLLIANSAVQVDGSQFQVRGKAVLDTGSLVTTNANATIGCGAAGVAQMTLSNGTWLALNVLVGNCSFTQSTLTLAGGTNSLRSSLYMGFDANVTGTVWVTGGLLLVTNQPTHVGLSGFGRLTISNGTVVAKNVTIAQNPGSAGTLTVAGGTLIAGQLVATSSAATIQFPAGTMTLQGAQINNSMDFTMGGTGQSAVLNLLDGTNAMNALVFYVGFSPNSTGTVWIGNGLTVLTNSIMVIGNNGGVGQVTVSNGALRIHNELQIANFGGQGTLTIAGGTNEVALQLTLANSATATGTVWMTGGFWDLSSAETYIANIGVGRMTVSNGAWRTRLVQIGNDIGSRGTLTIAGGTSSVYSNMILGNFACTATGIVNVVGGNLFVTNDTLDATLEVRSGTFTQSGGTLVIDRIVITNACGRFLFTGGSLATIAQILTGTFDADGDGIPNGADPGPFDPTDTGNDADGDGFTNLQEYQAGTNPTNSAAFLGITGIVTTNNDIRVTWMTAAGKTNALERTAGAAGSFSNNFTAITNIVTTGTVTNYLDVGAATNVPSLYYRLRLVP